MVSGDGGFLGVSEGSSDPPLVENAEFQARVVSKGEFLGRVYAPPKGAKDTLRPQNAACSRALRWARDAVAKDLERRHGKTFQRHLNCHRLFAKCRDGSERSELPIRQFRHSQSLYYAGLQTCGSPWACPHCAAKITERRCDEIQQAVDLWLALGNTVCMLTLTNSHHAGEPLRPMMDGQAKALAWLLSHKAVKQALKSACVVGHIRAWEVTQGRLAFNNGWHPHFHILLFIDVAAARDRYGFQEFGTYFFAKLIQGPLSALWLKACDRAGLGTPSAERGCKVDPDRGGGSAKYPAKMGLEGVREDSEGHRDSESRWMFSDEITRGQTKKAAKGKGETPFQLLDSVLETGDDEAAQLWIEYRVATKGRSQVSFSRGLRDLIGLDPALSDEEVASEVREDDPIWAYLSLHQWRQVLRARAQFELLRVGEEGGLDAVLAFLAGLPDRA